MNIFGKLLGSNKIIDAAIASGDALFNTAEEKAEWKLRMLKAYEPFKVAQRWLMLVISIPYMSAWVVTFLASFVVNVDAQITLLTDTYVGTAFALAVGFYYAGGFAEGAIRAKK